MIVEVIGQYNPRNDYNLDLFWSYKHMLRVQGNYYFKEIVLNIALFIPFGFLPPILFEKLDSIIVIVLIKVMHL